MAMTVKELKEILKKHKDDTIVRMIEPDGYYYDIENINLETVNDEEDAEFYDAEIGTNILNLLAD